ncbi:MAG TPA: cytochrome b5 domain-containing protein [Anaerolineales bacterium]|nr:cytochrome b5 domain-containing protein [Anaerolineales bacterium]
MLPSRLAFENAVSFNQKHGHENLGFVSAQWGFLPVKPPLLALPDYFKAWDVIAADLPSLFRTLQVRRAVDALPYLNVDEHHLPAEYLLRASSLVSILLHAYVRVEASAPATLPSHLMQAWEGISQRLDRPAPILSYVDLILYNWKLRDPQASPLMLVENLDLLFPTVGNEEERVFYLTQLEIAAACAPLMLAVIRAQEAASRDDVPALERELHLMLDVFRHASEFSVHKIDPNPYSRTYVDQVVWAKTVAPFAVPFIKGRVGPSGTAAPIFMYMDAFFGRESHASTLGRETENLLTYSPLHWRTLVEAVGKFSVRNYIARSGNRALQGLFDTLLEAYAGDKGYLGTHRLKAYGFLEIAFKAGRSLTIGGFKGLFRDKTWNQIDDELGHARNERYLGLTPHLYSLHLENGESSFPVSRNWITSLTLETRSDEMHYRPGDRISLLPENSPELIDRTLKALHAVGTESIHLNHMWQAHLQFRSGYSHETNSLPLSDLLRFGQIRPVNRATAKALFKITGSSFLGRILNARMEDQWELWDLLQMLERGGFDPRQLWKAEPWEPEHITRLVRPELPRLYSIASSPSLKKKLEISVAGLEYDSVESPVSNQLPRQGVASSFLRRLAEQAEGQTELTVRLSPSARFHLPADADRPIVMFAGGSGIAPFAGFLQERMQSDLSRNWLYFGTRTEAEIHHRDLLEKLAGAGRLHLRVALSREDKQIFLQDGRLAARSGTACHVDSLLDQDAETLWSLLRNSDEGGEQACFYICGRTGFAGSIISALRNVIRRFVDSDSKADDFFRQLMADRRIMLDIFTTYGGTSDQAGRVFDISDLVLHNNDSNGYWMALNGKVYDLSEFVHLHAGGRRILANNAGIDATRAYQSVQHHLNSDVDAQTGMYEIGRMRRLDFGMRWGVGLGLQGLVFFTLEEAFTFWVRYLYLVTEMENALINEFSFLDRSTTLGEDPREFTPLKAHLVAEAQKRFLGTFLDGILGEDLNVLWAITAGLCDRRSHYNWMPTSIQDTTLSASALHARANYLQTWIDEWRSQDEEVHKTRFEQAVTQLSSIIRAENLRCFHEIKLAVRNGVQAFERHEALVIEKDGAGLISTLQQIPVIVSSYYERLGGEMQKLAQEYGVPLKSVVNSAQVDFQDLGHGAHMDVTANPRIDTDG